MRYKRLGKSDMNVSVITVGTWAIGGQGWGDVDRKQSIEAINTMLDNGVNFIDTAPIYGQGYSEEVVGEAIKGRDRSSFMISTKVGLCWGMNAERGWRDNGRVNIYREIDLSLQRLGTDYVDMYLIHWPDDKTPIQETMEALESLVKAGKIRHFGVSNWNEAMITEGNKYGCISAIQPPYSMVNRSQEDLMKFAKEQDIGTMTYGSLGSGILTGAIREKPDWDPRDIRLNFYDFYKEPKFSKVQKLLLEMDKVAEQRGVPLAQVTINWSTQNPLVDTALLGVRNSREALENCKALDWELSQEEINTLNKALADNLDWK
ncbi:MAG: aldo/keto reductase [Eubacteriales bacterium]|nr:aldo/keto reductase [Eubacteriales bacterium]